MLPLFQTGGGGSVPTTLMSLIALLPNAKFISGYQVFTSPGAASQNDIYTVPAGKRAVLFGWNLSNAAAGAGSTFQPTVKISGTYYKLQTITGSLAAGTGNAVNLLCAYVAEAGETFSILQTTNTTWFVTPTIIEFDNTSSLKTLKVTSPASGDNTVYTVPANKRALVVGNCFWSPLSANTMAAFMYNATVGAITVNWNYLRGAASASTSNRIANAASVSNAVGAQAGQLGLMVVDTGDSLSANMSAGNTGGLIWINVMEMPT